MQPYPKDIDEKTLVPSLRVISRLRDQDITDRNTFDSRYVLGRKVGKVPTSSIDIAATDRIGDFNVTDSFAYYCIDNSGTAEWRRVGVSSW